MKNLILILLVISSFAVMALGKEPQAQDTFSQAVFTKAPAPSSVLDQIKGGQNKLGNQCVIDCLNAYQACLATAQGTAQVRYCEWAFEACMVDCGI